MSWGFFGVDYVKKLLSFLEGTSVSELEISRFGQRINITRAASPRRDKEQESKTLEGKIVSEEKQEPRKAVVYHTIYSATVGYFHSHAEDGDGPYVSLGETIRKGESIGEMESMNLRSPIISDYSGEITEIFVEERQPVEYGQPLFKLKTYGKKRI